MDRKIDFGFFEAPHPQFFQNIQTSDELKYSMPVSSMVFEILYLKAELELLQDRSVVLDGIFSYPPGWNRLEEISIRTKSDVFFVQIVDDISILRNRILLRKNDAFHSEADLHVLEKHWESMNKKQFPYPTRDPEFIKFGFHWCEILTETRDIVAGEKMIGSVLKIF